MRVTASDCHASGETQGYQKERSRDGAPHPGLCPGAVGRLIHSSEMKAHGSHEAPHGGD